MEDMALMPSALASIPPSVAWALDVLNWVVQNPGISVGILLGPTLLVGWLCSREQPRLRPIYAWVLASISILGILHYAYVALTYCREASFIDHCEPQVACASYLLLHGKPIYLPPTGPDIYSLQYGPYTYIWVTAYYLLLNPSIFAAKLAGVVSGLGGVAFLLAALKRIGSWWAACFCTFLAVTLYFRFDLQSLWCRPDSHQILLICVSLFALTLDNAWLSAALIGISAGISFDLKIHSLVCFLPIVIEFYFRFRRSPAALLGIVLATAAAAAPFLLPGISLSNYVKSLLVATRHPLDPDPFDQTILYAAWMLGILLILGIPSVWSKRVENPQKARQWSWSAAALGAAFLITLPFASKTGAGGRHLMPLVPILAWLLAQSWSIERPAESASAPSALAIRHWLIVPIFLVAAVYNASVGYTLITYLHERDPVDREIIADVQRITDFAGDRSVEMGVGGDSDYGLTFVHPLLVFEGNPYHIEPCAAMDIAEADHGLPQATTDLCRSGLAEFVLIPVSDPPFSIPNHYPGHKPLFSSKFIEAFEQNYHLRLRSTFFDVYQRNLISDRN
jgi:hypothetical protein